MSRSSEKRGGFQVRSVVGPWDAFRVSLAECALPAMRCSVAAPVDTSGARDAQHWDTPDFLAGVLEARALEFIKADSHMPHRLPAVFPHRCVVSSRAGCRVCVLEQAPARLCTLPLNTSDLSRGATRLRRCRFLTSSLSLPALCCHARRWRSFLTPGLGCPTMPITEDTAI